MSEPKLSKTLKRMAEVQRERESRATVANWLRRVAERISPDDTYMFVRGRAALSPRAGLVFQYTPMSDDSHEPTAGGVRLYMRRIDREATVRR